MSVKGYTRDFIEGLRGLMSLGMSRETAEEAASVVRTFLEDDLQSAKFYFARRGGEYYKSLVEERQEALGLLERL